MPNIAHPVARGAEFPFADELQLHYHDCYEVGL